MTTDEELWDAVSALPAVDPEALGQTVMVGILRRIFECHGGEGGKSFSIYRLPAGVVAIVAVPETMSYRLHFAPNGYPAANRVLALVGGTEDESPPPVRMKEWDDQLCDAN